MSKAWLKFLFFSLMLSVLSYSHALASEFPNDAVTVYVNDSTNASGTVFTVPSGQTYTVLHVQCIDNAANPANSTSLSLNSSSRSVIYMPPAFTIRTQSWSGSQAITSTGTVTWAKTATVTLKCSITYVPYDLSTIPTTETTLASINTGLTAVDTSVTGITSYLTSLQIDDFMQLLLGFFIFFVIVIALRYFWFIFRSLF